jgi:hypothetical protein
MKSEVFHQMAHVGASLSLHEGVVKRAKELFAGFRDDRENVLDKQGIVAACLWEAFDEHSRSGKQLLRSKIGVGLEAKSNFSSALAGKKRSRDENGKGGKGQGTEKQGGENRAVWRDAMHNSVQVAGTVNTLSAIPDSITSIVDREKKAREDSGKAISTWEAQDIRNFFAKSDATLAANADAATTATATTADAAVPSSLSSSAAPAIEEKYVNMLIEAIEKLDSSSSKASASKFSTPRVDMGNCGIKWQGSHERGSGGAGGIGGSGGMQNGERRRGRAPGQHLLLLTVPKLRTIFMGDEEVAKKVNSLIRAAVGAQKNAQKNVVSAQGAVQRFKQSKRRPWVEARAAQKS